MFQIVKNDILGHKDKLVKQEEKISQIITDIQKMKKENETLNINVELLYNKQKLAGGDLDKILDRVKIKKQKIIGFENSSKKADINPHLTFLAENPMSAFKGMVTEMELLKLNIQKEANTIQEIKISNIQVSYQGEMAYIRLPSQDGDYRFQDLKEDVCIYFNQSVELSALLDDTYSVWPDKFQVQEQLNNNSKFKIILSDKTSKKPVPKKLEVIEFSEEEQDEGVIMAAKIKQDINKKKDKLIMEEENSEEDEETKKQKEEDKRVQKRLTRQQTGQTIISKQCDIFCTSLYLFLIVLLIFYYSKTSIMYDVHENAMQKFYYTSFHREEEVNQNYFRVNVEKVEQYMKTTQTLEDIYLWMDQVFVENLNLYCDDSGSRKCTQNDMMTKYPDSIYKDGIKKRSFFGYSNQLVGKIRLVQFRASDNCDFWKPFSKSYKDLYPNNQIFCSADYENEDNELDFGIYGINPPQIKPPLPAPDNPYKSYCSYTDDKTNNGFGLTDNGKNAGITLLQCQAWAAFRFERTETGIFDAKGYFNTFEKNRYYIDIDQDYWQLKDIIRTLRETGSIVNANVPDSTQWLDLKTRSVMFVFHTVNLAESVFTSYHIGFEIHASGMIKPFFKLYSYVDAKLILRQLQEDLFYFVIQIYVFFYSFVQLIRIFQFYNENQQDLEFAEEYFKETEVRMSLISYSLMLLDMVLKIVELNIDSVQDEFIIIEASKTYMSIGEFTKLKENLVYAMRFCNLSTTLVLIIIKLKSRKIQMLNFIMYRAWRQLLGLGIVMAIITASISYLFNLIYGNYFSQFNTPFISYYNVLNYLIGYQDEYQKLMVRFPTITPILFFLINTFTFITLNSLLSAVFIETYESGRIIYDHYEEIVPEQTSEENTRLFRQELRNIFRFVYKRFKRYLKRLLRIFT